MIRLAALALVWMGLHAFSVAYVAAQQRTIPVANAADLKLALKSIQAGDTIQFAAGTWSDLEFTITAEGRPDAPITLQADPDKVLFTGHCRARIGGKHIVMDGFTFKQAWHEDAVLETRASSKQPAAYCVIRNCTFDNCNPPDLSDESKVVSLYGQNHRFEYCAIQGKRNRGTTLVVWLAERSGGHRIHHNYFGPRERLGKNGGETIRIGDSETSTQSGSCIVSDNFFDRCNGEAEVISNKSGDNAYLFNTFRECSGALTLRHGHRCRVVGNFFDGRSAKGTGGVRVIGERHVVAFNLFSHLKGEDQRAALSIMNGIKNSPADGYSPVKQACVAFNSFVECRQSLVIGLIDDDNPGTVPPVECDFIGNIVSSRSGPLLQARTSLDGVRIHENDWFGSEVGDRLDPDNLLIDPGWSADEFAIYRLSVDVQLTAQGNELLLGLALPDIDGFTRSFPSTMGCAPITRGSNARRPVTKEDVGPKAERREPPG